MLELKLLTLLLLVNGSPVAVRAVLGERLARPLDGGIRLADGRPLLGPSKTLTGVVVAILAGALAAPLLGLPWTAGALIGAGSMLGDAASSFAKRRLGMASGQRAIGLDQLPEAFVGLLACRPVVDLDWPHMLIIPPLFMLADIAISRLLWLLGFRQHPH